MSDWKYKKSEEEFNKSIERYRQLEKKLEDFKERQPKPLSKEEEILEVLNYVSGSSSGRFPNYRFEVVTIFRKMFMEGISSFKIKDTIKEMRLFFDLHIKDTLRHDEIIKHTTILDILPSYPVWDLGNRFKKSSDKSKNQRKSIPTSIMDKVWNRDGGKCVQCGSKENIEFDHIIPFSKGGANTYRNLQILCRKCNRKKKDKIG